jgi:hypothetical protein
MEFSIRDERGQGVIEYILLLVVIVSIALGGLYQLNSAFQVFAKSYFGDYLACLLETGELPSISGTPGDSGTCNAQFKEFNFADGRPLAKGNGGSGSSDADGQKKDGRSSRDSSTAEGGATAVGGASGSTTGEFRGGGAGSRGNRTAVGRGRTGKMDAYTGSSGVSDYGSRARGTSTKINLKSRLDTGFALRDEEEEKQKSSSNFTRKPSEASSAKKTSTQINRNRLKRDDGSAPDSGMTFGNFIRFLIIAALLIALLLFIGGQMLQINKSMDGG